MSPHLKDRPVAMVRAPSGIAGGELFFQKHAERTAMPGLTAHSRDLWPKHPPLLTVDTVDALLSAAQMNVVELHTWNSTVSKLDSPDRVIFAYFGERDRRFRERDRFGGVWHCAVLIVDFLVSSGRVRAPGRWVLGMPF
ncbi:hypothetical protein [Paraburkholderia azotifigens]|uniref:non-homologous end-joining DNA ligase LigD n=1 Tax=Paraburkholderia azotifigens TaxID=2057004 RepID=UPI003083FF82